MTPEQARERYDEVSARLLAVDDAIENAKRDLESKWTWANERRVQDLRTEREQLEDQLQPLRQIWWRADPADVIADGP